MTEMIEWLRAQLDADERIARAAIHDPRYGRDERATADDGVWRTRDHAHDECVVWGVGIMIYDEGGHTAEQASHIATHDPARVLRQVQAHRAILDEWAKVTQPGMKRPRYSGDAEEWFSGHDAGYVKALEFAIKALLSIYSDRDGYNPDWSA